jgi:SAM-dependent methyltransferase
MPNENWPDRGKILEMAGGFRAGCVLGAAAELDLFTIMGPDALRAEQVAQRLDSDLRATRMLLDALAALRLMEKQGELYSVPEALGPLLSQGTRQTVLPMIQHTMTILRAWTQLAWTVRAGFPGPRTSSIRGAEADRAAFVAAMHTVSGPIADELVAELGPLAFRRLLDVGGASGTWTMALLRAAPEAKATIFDLPDAIKQARGRFAGTVYADRIDFVEGDFYEDDLPAGADFAWVSAIIHQHSREESRELFGKVYRALKPGGRVAIRDVVMEPCRTRPVMGALFAINMLANTERGGTFTFEEIAEDLLAAGFVEPKLQIKTDEMNSVVIARKA